MGLSPQFRDLLSEPLAANLLLHAGGIARRKPDTETNRALRCWAEPRKKTRSHRVRPMTTCRKYTPANIQKIQDWVAEGISREEIAKSLGVTVGSLQVTCSRLGISLRNPKMFEHRRRVGRRIPNHPPMVGHIGPQYPRFQIRIVLEHDGKRCETDVPLMGLDIARLGLAKTVFGGSASAPLTPHRGSTKHQVRAISFGRGGFPKSRRNLGRALHTIA